MIEEVFLMWFYLLLNPFRRNIFTRSDEDFSSSGTLIFTRAIHVYSSPYPAWLTPGLNDRWNNSRNDPRCALVFHGVAGSEMEVPPYNHGEMISTSDVCWRVSYGKGPWSCFLVYSGSLLICSRPITTRWCCWSSWHCWPLTCSSTPSVNCCGQRRSYSSCSSCECITDFTTSQVIYRVNLICSILKEESLCHIFKILYRHSNGNGFDSQMNW